MACRGSGDKECVEVDFFESGAFMNQLASGTPGVGHLAPNVIFEVESCEARMPGDGSAFLALTRGRM